uniref:Uncharacterized protein n=1 Tax=Octopus bimaculoides TaxID=37653 RepID=A0A0L8HVE0_OCTBM
MKYQPREIITHTGSSLDSFVWKYWSQPSIVGSICHGSRPGFP